MNARNSQDRTLSETLALAVDALGDVFSLHLALAKAELQRDARGMGRSLLPLAAGIPLILIGYLLLCLAAATALAPWIGSAGGFAALGGLNLLAGGIASRVTVSRLNQPHQLELTVGSELARTARDVVPTASPDADAERPLEVPVV